MKLSYFNFQFLDRPHIYYKNNPLFRFSVNYSNTFPNALIIFFGPVEIEVSLYPAAG